MRTTILAGILALALGPIPAQALSDFTYSAALPALSEGNFLDELNSILGLPKTVQGSVTGLDINNASSFTSATSNIDSFASAVPTVFYATADMLTEISAWEFSATSGTISVQLYFDTDAGSNGCGVATAGWCIFGTDNSGNFFDAAVAVDTASSSVPAPATLALLGLGLLGFGHRRRQH